MSATLPRDSRREQQRVTVSSQTLNGPGWEFLPTRPTKSQKQLRYPDQKLHLIMDNYATHKHPKVKAWLAAHPRIHIHFTPTSGSWLNLVEVWFGIIERQAIHRGTYQSVRDLMIKIRAFINGWNDRCQPFVWTKTADQILSEAANRPTTSVAAH